MKKYKHIIFDLDGTLSDPGLGITNSIMYALKKFGIEAERSALYKFIGPPLRESFGTFYGFDKDQAEQAVRYYREYFSEKGIFENELYHGISDLLAGLNRHNNKLYIATSKPREYTMRILEHFEIGKYFDFVSGSNMDGSMSAKSDLINRIIPRIDRDEMIKTIMIGDRRYDIEGAKHHGIDSAAVLYGYGERIELEQVEPTYLIETTEKLADLLLGQ
ncbi:MAG TPA: HAD-IA family hydrolase [Spirochaetota bacterium]|nr:HAD-IA family hydrolase [Spirochaetota bacterium]HPS87825.1 HAD-IA family hydrolase [Spirochaetota bacterium]